MSITIQTVGMKLSDTLQEYAAKKMEDTLRVFGNMDRDTLRIEVKLARHQKDGERFRASAKVTFPGEHFFIEEESDELQKAIAQLKRTLMKRVRRWRERVTDKHQNAGS